MGKFRLRPIIVDAVQWFKHGDHSAVKTCAPRGRESAQPMGWIGSAMYGEKVLPGDWIVTTSDGQSFACDAKSFEIVYEPISS